MIVGSLITWYLKTRIQNIESFIEKPIETQQRVFDYLISMGKNTELGKQYDFASMRSYQDFSRDVPLVTYEDFEPLIERTRLGETNVIWPTKIKWFAKSSGTTNAKSKFIPISNESLEDCHFKAGKDMLSLYVRNNPDTQVFQGKAMRLGGSQELHEAGTSSFGDLSAIIIQNTPFWADMKSVPNQEVSLMSDWEPKLKAIVNRVIKEDVRSMGGVPSWMMVLLNRILLETNKTTIAEVFPNLEVFFHGGISFKPYVESYQQILGKTINYCEVYNASEGFFGLQDTHEKKEMLLMLDYGIFYEFIPMETFHSDNPTIIPLQEVEIGKNYALVITTNGGLWRYVIGDTVKFTSIAPYRIIVSGRTKHYINAFGEELIIENAEEALHFASNATQAKIKDYTAGPVYMKGKQSGAHEWIIEFEQEPNNFEKFTFLLDQHLQDLNSDYEAKRYNNMTLNFPIIHKGRENLFFDWMKKRGKLGGQNKVPRLANTREFLDPLLEMNRS